MPAARASERDLSYLLALGFGTSVLMWAIGYVCRLPPVVVPSPLLLTGLLLCQELGGFIAGRWSGAGARAGLFVGGASALINLLVLGSLLSGSSPNEIVPSALVWVPGSLLAGGLLGWIGGALGARHPRSLPNPFVGRTDGARGSVWSGPFALVAAVATYCLLIVGGLVTSQAAGLAVVDWPNSFGYGMFLYPLSKMTGGIYYEHAHRLFGSLVGLVTLALTLHLARVDSRRWVKALAWTALVSVVIQGILGGLRVTGRFTMSHDPAHTAPNLLLAVVHGVFGQVVFGLLVLLAAATSHRWRSLATQPIVAGTGADRALTLAFVLLLLTQLVAGAVLRHLSGALLVHITLAVFVLIVGTTVGVRSRVLYRDAMPLATLGSVLLALLGCQLLLGIGSLVVTGLAKGSTVPPLYEVAVTTAHQAIGAALLATAVLLAAWTRRLVAAR